MGGIILHDLIKVLDSEFGIVRPQIKQPDVLSDGSKIDPATGLRYVELDE